jgi:hypothetical protein
MRKTLFSSAVMAGMSVIGLVLVAVAPVSASEPVEPMSPSVGMEPATPTRAVPQKPKPSGVGVLNAACSYAATDVDSSAWVQSAAGANIRSGSGTSCRIYDQADSGDTLDYHCYTVGNDGFTWTYLRDESDGTNGWVRDDLLSDFGSFVACTALV